MLQILAGPPLKGVPPLIYHDTRIILTTAIQVMRQSGLRKLAAPPHLPKRFLLVPRVSNVKSATLMFHTMQSWNERLFSCVCKIINVRSPLPEFLGRLCPKVFDLAKSTGLSMN